MIRNSHDYGWDVGNLHMLDYRLRIALINWPWRGRDAWPHSHLAIDLELQRDADEERSGAYR